MSRIQEFIPHASITLGILLLLFLMLKPPTATIVDEISSIISQNPDNISIAAKYEGENSYIITHNADNFVHPGSNYKLLTTAVVLDELGPEYMFQTELLAAGESVVLRGTGDPSLTRYDLESLSEGVEADTIIYDDTWFLGEQYGPDWDPAWYDDHFAVPISALQIDNNLLNLYATPIDDGWSYLTYPLSDVRVRNNVQFKEEFDAVETGIIATSETDDEILLTGDGDAGYYFETSVTVKDPALLTAKVLREIVNPDAEILDVNTVNLTTTTQIGLNFSSPAADLLKEMLTFSRNNYAESFIRILGEERLLEKGASQEKGVKVLENFLVEIGVPADQMALFDGSGLSPNTRFTTRNMANLLEHTTSEDWGRYFWQALPSGGEGTLAFRFQGMPDRQRIIAKSGTHEDSHSLSGMITGSSRNIIFSINVVADPQTALTTLDELVLALDQQF